MNNPSDPTESYQRQLAIISVVLTIAAAIFSIVQGAPSTGIAVLVLAACGVAWLVLSGYGRRTIAVGKLRLSWNVAAAAFLLVVAALVLAVPRQTKQEIGFRNFPVDKNAPRPKLVESAAACIADLKQQYSCHAFREKVANSPSILMSNDPQHMTLDEPLELAIAVGQGKMLTGGGEGDYCALYESSIAEACNTLAGGDASGPR